LRSKEFQGVLYEPRECAAKDVLTLKASVSSQLHELVNHSWDATRVHFPLVGHVFFNCNGASLPNPELTLSG
jgi:hypothetical protein